MGILNNTGRFIQVKKAFLTHLIGGVNTIIPSTKQLGEYNTRPIERRVMVADDRMVDKVESVIAQYQKGKAADDKSEVGGSPLPVVIVAFAKDMTPSSRDIHQPIPNERTIRLENADGKLGWYRIRTAQLSNRIQIVFMGNDSETVRSITAQLRLWFQSFGNRRFKINWNVGNLSFTSSAAIDDTDFMDSLIDIDERSNLTIITWDVSIDFQMPFLGNGGSKVDYMYDDDGNLLPIPTVNRIDIDIVTARKTDNRGRLVTWGRVERNKQTWNDLSTRDDVAERQASAERILTSGNGIPYDKKGG